MQANVVIHEFAKRYNIIKQLSIILPKLLIKCQLIAWTDT